MVVVVATGDLLLDHQRQPVLVEHLEPIVPFDEFVAAGVGWSVGAILVLIGCLVED